jgi:hypothetical protein
VETGGTTGEVAAPLPTFAKGLCDDAAVFPPGRMPLHEAVPSHVGHESAVYAELVGPLIIAAPALGDLAPLLPQREWLNLAVTFPGGPEQVGQVLAAAADLPVTLRALEIVVPAGATAAQLCSELDRALTRSGEVEVYVEIPRDDRRADVLRALAGTPYHAKFRTGGVTAELYPDENELAAAIGAAVAAGLPFKATAGLHHAIRNTDPETGFDQHGFLNLLLAVDAALHGAGPAELAGILQDRHADIVAGRIGELGDARVAAARACFRSFGTCSIMDPLTDLVELGLVTPASIGPQAEKE